MTLKAKTKCINDKLMILTPSVPISTSDLCGKSTLQQQQTKTHKYFHLNNREDLH